MGEDGQWMEEKYIGNRLFRRMGDGRILEVLSDGSTRDDFEVGGRSFTAYDADFNTISETYSGESQQPPEPPPEPPPEEKPPEMKAPHELTLQERMAKFMRKQHASHLPQLDSDDDASTQEKMKEYIKQKMEEGKQTSGGRGNPFSQMHQGHHEKAEGKPRSYKEHMMKVFGTTDYKDQIGGKPGFRGFGSKKTAAKKTGRFGRSRK
ncbi:MAG: hypothetical protein GF416_03485 [Candidatus Altiarchaeales archaeon]|nr:hypothetical protein [Candidatus Altiarchaeales archaeon]MBD3416182.1 hypothetical protein [Candidatus Altiarchaeales archaeon]